ncbi:helix-turn-helix domain-containing protein [Nocardia sp. NBC_00416]|uniref:helix-turn-helix domain-containing protein n=1 Tax=Nocardia sp. NBC_00416 TaxID=2975991 RepID=UPI002E1F9D62
MVIKKNPFGPTGDTVRNNVLRYRNRMNLGYADLARRLEALGRPIPVLGLSRIERGERRIDVDDLMALAVALGVSPTSLLLPDTSGSDDVVTATGIEGTAADLLGWLRLHTPSAHIGKPADDRNVRDAIRFIADARPRWDIESLTLEQLPGVGHQAYAEEIAEKARQANPGAGHRA